MALGCSVSIIFIGGSIRARDLRLRSARTGAVTLSTSRHCHLVGRRRLKAVTLRLASASRRAIVSARAHDGPIPPWVAVVGPPNLAGSTFWKRADLRAGRNRNARYF